MVSISLGRLFVIAGPSSTGKTTTVQRLQRDGLVTRAVSHTTRCPRPGERDGDDYHFVTDAAFQRLVEGGQMMVDTEWCGHRYGTVVGQAGTDNSQLPVVSILDVKGTEQAAKHFDVTGIFFLPEDKEAWRERVQRRDNPEERIVRSESDTWRARINRPNSLFQHVIATDDLDAKANTVAAIVTPRPPAIMGT